VPEEKLVVRVGSRSLRGLARSYGDAPIGTLVAIIGSSGRLEVAQVGGDAATRFGLGEGDPIIVSAGDGNVPGKVGPNAKPRRYLAPGLRVDLASRRYGRPRLLNSDPPPATCSLLARGNSSSAPWSWVSSSTRIL
jgi:hypothetical protein